MARNNSYFAISGFISLSLFIFFLSLFFMMIFSSPKINTFALKKDDYISISLELINTTTTKTKKDVEVIKEEIEVPKKEVVTPKEDAQSVEEVKNIDIDDLFSDVWTKDINVKKVKKKVDNKRLELINKKIKTKKNNSVKPSSSNASNSESETSSDKNKKSSSGDEVNEYLAKIQAIVYKYFYPPNNSQGHTVKAVIELNAIGKIIDFRILSYSSNQALNQECDKIKDRLVGVLFPKNPQNRSSSTIVNITSDKN